jgi:tRNA pseudouridine55 synthase
MSRPSGQPIDGLLLVDKPGGLTSHDVVNRMRRHLGFKKIGHGGTLDPMATGLLVLLLGRGTKLSAYVMAADKTYEGTMRLGVSTNTEDAEGAVLAEADPSGVREEDLRAQMAARCGDMMQTPPMVSAVKIDGVPLYKLARKGQVVEREPRLIHIYAFELVAWRPPEADFRITCTKGTYVRSLCADIGGALGCGGHLAALRRTASGSFRVADAIPLAEAMETPPAVLADRVIPPHQVQTIGPRMP